MSPWLPMSGRSQSSSSQLWIWDRGLGLCVLRGSLTAIEKSVPDAPQPSQRIRGGLEISQWSPPPPHSHFFPPSPSSLPSCSSCFRLHQLPWRCKTTWRSSSARHHFTEEESGIQRRDGGPCSQAPELHAPCLWAHWRDPLCVCREWRRVYLAESLWTRALNVFKRNILVKLLGW